MFQLFSASHLFTMFTSFPVQSCIIASKFSFVLIQHAVSVFLLEQTLDMVHHRSANKTLKFYFLLFFTPLLLPPPSVKNDEFVIISQSNRFVVEPSFPLTNSMKGCNNRRRNTIGSIKSILLYRKDACFKCFASYHLVECTSSGFMYTNFLRL